MKKIFLLLIFLFLFTAPAAYAVTQIDVNCAGGTWVSNGDGTQRCVANTPSTGNSNGTVAQNQGTNLGYTPLEPIPGITTGANGVLDFPHLLGNIYKIAIIIGALFSVLMLTISGIRYMVSDIVTSKEKAKKRITACLYGLVLIAASYLILNTINPQLVTFNLNPGSATVTGAPPYSPNNTVANPTDPSSYKNEQSCNQASYAWNPVTGCTFYIWQSATNAYNSAVKAGAYDGPTGGVTP